MTPERLAEIRAACEAATPGPWEVAPYWMEDSCLSDVISPYRKPTRAVAMDCFSHDANFIALARSAIPELLAEVERLRAQFNLEAENARLRAEVEAMRAERDAVRAEVDRLRAGATRECGMLDLGHTEPANVCDACYVQVVHMLGEVEAENARLRAELDAEA